MNSSTLNAAKHAITATALAISLLSFNALATSPVQPNLNNDNAITTQSFTAADHQTQAATKMFPAPTAGMVQHILTLPALADESNYMVEIQIGQTKVENCNRQVLSGKITQHSVKGWGYNYYQVDSISEGPSTLMACMRRGEPNTVFVPIEDDLKLSYDSRLAKVFYLPEGSEIRYRTWRVESPFSTSKATVKS
jgi:ecotin